MTQCPAFIGIRVEIFHQYTIDLLPDWRPKQLLAFVGGSALDGVFRMVEGEEALEHDRDQESSESQEDTDELYT